MPEQQHQVIDVLSHNKVGSHNTIIIAAIPVIAITAVLVAAIIPYMHTIGLMLELLIGVAIC